jgi:hypothetical protein
MKRQLANEELWMLRQGATMLRANYGRCPEYYKLVHRIRKMKDDRYIGSMPKGIQAVAKFLPDREERSSRRRGRASRQRGHWSNSTCTPWPAKVKGLVSLRDRRARRDQEED